MVTRQDIVAFLDTQLNIAGWDDLDASRNGLQVVGRDEGTLVLGATDASQALFDIASARDAFLVIVHHGLFWADIQRVDVVVKNRLKSLFQRDVNLYAAHLPLDAHPTLGNNAQLLGKLGIRDLTPFGTYRGRKIGFRGILPQSRPFHDFVEDFKHLLNATDIMLMPHGPKTCQSVAIDTGAASASIIAEATMVGVDTLIVGEAGHTFFHLSKEYKVNVIAGGHYATETWGIQALLRILQQEFADTKTEFIALPTGF
ncbi:MAG: hypothetical protein RBG13Loki_1694 [Promethearchaeota archaeon CR_4]|nr:MAG: hypothetical protein RBG13Loki_1694 [Candidatus Lokiarchaeota archaeon CR_4]